MGVNEVTRGLERMPPNRGDEKSVDDGGEARCGYFQVGCSVGRGFFSLFTYAGFDLCGSELSCQ